MLDPTDVQQLVSAIRTAMMPSVLPYQLCRQLDFTEKSFAITPSSPKQIAQPNALRVAIGFHTLVTTIFPISTSQSLVGSQGFGLTVNNAPIWYDINRHGTLPQQGWYANASSGGTLTVWEILWRSPN